MKNDALDIAKQGLVEAQHALYHFATYTKDEHLREWADSANENAKHTLSRIAEVEGEDKRETQLPSGQWNGTCHACGLYILHETRYATKKDGLIRYLCEMCVKIPTPDGKEASALDLCQCGPDSRPAKIAASELFCAKCQRPLYEYTIEPCRFCERSDELIKSTSHAHKDYITTLHRAEDMRFHCTCRRGRKK